MKSLDIKHFLLSHLVWVVGLAVALVAYHSWIGEHDARMFAVQEQRAADAQVKTLQQQIIDRDKQATVQVAPIVKIIHDVQTVPQAIQALPTVTTQPLPLPVLPAPSGGITIPEPDVLPLFDQVADDKVCRSLLATANSDLSDTRGIVKERDNEIKVLRKPKSFWSRTKSTLKIIGIGVGIGVALGSKL